LLEGPHFSKSKHYTVLLSPAPSWRWSSITNQHPHDDLEVEIASQQLIISAAGPDRHPCCHAVQGSTHGPCKAATTVRLNEPCAEGPSSILTSLGTRAYLEDSTTATWHQSQYWLAL
jgi:hypothetical protein